MKTCTYPDCSGADRPQYAHGLCKYCYDRLLARPPGRAGMAFAPARFYLTLAQAGRGRDDCWPWPGYVDPISGYGQGGGTWAHRFAIVQAGVELPPAHDVDHGCHTADRSCAGGSACSHRPCVNFRHLIVMPVGMNRSQTAATGRLTCSNDHPKAIHAYQLSTTGVWRCRACDRASRLRLVQRRVAAGDGS